MSVFESKSKVTTVMPTAINQGTRIEGDMTSDGDIRLDGYMSGNMQSKAKVVIGAAGSIDGNIACYSADISGQVSGNIEAKDILFLKSSAVVNGNISVGKLVIESGAKFNGNCTMTAHTVSLNATSTNSAADINSKQKKGVV